VLFVLSQAFCDAVYVVLQLISGDYREGARNDLGATWAIWIRFALCAHGPPTLQPRYLMNAEAYGTSCLEANRGIVPYGNHEVAVAVSQGMRHKQV